MLLLTEVPFECSFASVSQHKDYIPFIRTNASVENILRVNVFPVCCALFRMACKIELRYWFYCKSTISPLCITVGELT